MAITNKEEFRFIFEICEDPDESTVLVTREIHDGDSVEERRIAFQRGPAANEVYRILKGVDTPKFSTLSDHSDYVVAKGVL